MQAGLNHDDYYKRYRELREPICEPGMQEAGT